MSHSTPYYIVGINYQLLIASVLAITIQSSVIFIMARLGVEAFLEVYII